MGCCVSDVLLCFQDQIDNDDIAIDMADIFQPPPDILRCTACLILIVPAMCWAAANQGRV